MFQKYIGLPGRRSRFPAQEFRHQNKKAFDLAV